MPDSARFALHRPELGDRLIEGEASITSLMGATRRTYPSGRILIEADKPHEYVYRMVDGWAGRIRTLPDGRSQYILIFLPGDLFAVKSMFVTRHPDSVETLSNCIIEQVDHRNLRQAYDSDPNVALRCTWQVVEEERRLHSWVVGLGRGSAEERLALLLCDFHGRLARSGKIGADDVEFAMPMTQQQLGDHLGLSAVHINRVVRAMREDGVASIRSGKVKVHDPDRLKRLAEPLQDYFERTTPEFGG